MNDVYILAAIVLAWVILYAVVRGKIAAANKENARNRMGKRCTGPVFVTFERRYEGLFQEGFVDHFGFTNREFAIRFRRMNGLDNS
jgi:hypothetical protein